MKEIQLSKNQIALVDDEDFEELSKHKWWYHKGYAVRTTEKRINGVSYKETIRMHRQIMSAEKGAHVDHINRKKADNRKSNLRLCSPSRNSQNRGPQSNNTSGYKGVSKNLRTGSWTVQIMSNGKRKRIGDFKCVHEAANAYNEAAKELHGEFACLNEIKKDSLRQQLSLLDPVVEE